LLIKRLAIDAVKLFRHPPVDYKSPYCNIAFEPAAIFIYKAS